MQACITDLRASLIAATAAACVISHVLMGLIGGCNAASTWSSAAAAPCMFNENTQASLVPLCRQPADGGLPRHGPERLLVSAAGMAVCMQGSRRLRTPAMRGEGRRQ